MTEKEFSSKGVRSLNDQNYADAFEIFKAGSSKWPGNLMFITGQGVAQFYLENYYEALELSHRVIDQNETAHEAWKLQARVLMKLGFEDSAKAILGRLAASAPKDRQVRSLIKDIVCDLTVSRRDYNVRHLNELVLTEWPQLLREEQIINKLKDLGVPVDRVNIRGRTLILYYNDVRLREEARILLEGINLSKIESEFFLGNCASVM